MPHFGPLYIITSNYGDEPTFTSDMAVVNDFIHSDEHYVIDAATKEILWPDGTRTPMKETGR